MSSSRKPTSGVKSSVAWCLVGASLVIGATASTETRSVEDLMKTATIPGLSMATIADGEIEVRHFGVADVEAGNPVTSETVFEAASLSKPVFATLVLNRVADGTFDLDQPLWELLPEPRLSKEDRARSLTARHVLAHTSGLPNWGGDELKMRREPGKRFGYSGEGYVYLQKVLEHLTGSTLDELARREIFEPLGMQHSLFLWSDGDEIALARPHDPKGVAREKRQIREANSAASLHTTANDYARFVLAWIDGSLVDEDVADLALSPISHPAPKGKEEARARQEGRLAWGLGWGLFLPRSGNRQEPTIVWHWGDNGPFKAFVAWSRETQSGIVYFTNSANGLGIGPEMMPTDLGSLEPVFDWMGYPRLAH